MPASFASARAKEAAIRALRLSVRCIPPSENLRSNARMAPLIAPLADAPRQADGSAASLDAEAKAAFAAGRHEEAAALFGQLLLTGPLEPHLVLCNRSAAWARLGKWAEAEGDARLAMASAPPSFVKAPYRLACALQGCGRLDEVRVSPAQRPPAPHGSPAAAAHRSTHCAPCSRAATARPPR